MVFYSDGKLGYLEEPNGNRVTAGYNGDQLTSLTHSSGQSLELTYNGAGLIQTITDPDGRTTTLTYDPTNEHLVRAEYPDSTVVGYTYSQGQGITGKHALTEVEFPGGSHQFFSYDSRGRLETSSRDGGAELLTFNYDETGKILTTDALGNTAEFDLDQRGLVLKAKNGLGNIMRLAYDDEGNLVRVTDPAGFSYNYDYDGFGNVVEMTDPLGATTMFQYDGPFNRLTKLVDAKGNETDYSYDGLGNLESTTYADGSHEWWTHDGLGNATAWTNRRDGAGSDTTVTYAFDTDGRLASKVFKDGSRMDYEYDRGNLALAVSGTDSIFLSYDSEDHLERITYPEGRYLEYAYNEAGQRASSTDQLGHRLDYHYDAAGRLESITDESSNEVVHYYYDAAGRSLSIRFGQCPSEFRQQFLLSG